MDKAICFTDSTIYLTDNGFYLTSRLFRVAFSKRIVHSNGKQSARTRTAQWAGTECGPPDQFFALEFIRIKKSLKEIEALQSKQLRRG